MVAHSASVQALNTIGKTCDRRLRASPPVFLGKASYVTYPHNNAFAGGGESFIYVQAREGMLVLYSRRMVTGQTSALGEIGPVGAGGGAWHDVALEAGRVAVVFDSRARIMNLASPGAWIDVYRAQEGSKLDGLCSLSRDGNRLLCRESRDGVHRAIEIDLLSGLVRELFSKSWYANHFHYCPHDENWIAFSHEGPAEEITDRCWIWHAEHAPAGRLAFDQRSGEPDKRLCMGHERWGFHDVSAYVPAYAVSPAGPRGLYEIFADERPAKLLWESDVLWHCSMDLSGRYVAVDTTGPLTEAPLTPEEFLFFREKHLQTDRDRSRNKSDVGIIDLQARQILHLATVERFQHPYHPHPAISPDGQWVVWGDGSEENPGIWLAALSLE